MNIWGVAPDAMVYNTMIKLCAETRQYEKAMTFLDDMDMDDHRPSRITMETLFRAAATAPQWIRVINGRQTALPPLPPFFSSSSRRMPSLLRHNHSSGVAYKPR